MPSESKMGSLEGVSDNVKRFKETATEQESGKKICKRN